MPIRPPCSSSVTGSIIRSLGARSARTSIAPAARFEKLGVEHGDRVVLISRNRYEWIVCDLAIQLAGGTHVPVHASLAGPQIAYQIVDSGAKVVILSGPDQAEKLVDQVTKFAKSTKFVSLDPCPKPVGPFAVSLLSDLTAKVDDSTADKVEARALETVKPEDLATILYTSGTTGEPKGVMLTQKNLASNVSAILKMWVPNDDDVRLTWLPLSHILRGRATSIRGSPPARFWPWPTAPRRCRPIARKCIPR